MRLSLFVISLIIIQTSFSQTIRSKDGIELGERSTFVESCVGGSREKMMDVNGMQFKTYDYCSCVCDQLIPNLNFRDMEIAMKEDKLVELFLQDDNLNIILDCLDGNYTIDESYEFNAGAESDVAIEIAKKQCVKEIINDPEMGAKWDEEFAEEYCSCALEKLYNSGYTYKDLMQIEDENSETFNEIAVPCITEILAKQKESKNKYIPSDIIGKDEISKVELIDYLGQGFKVKLKIGGISKYFLFDTGASDLIINKDFKRDLLIEGVITKQSYVGEETYLMANNEEAKAQVVLIDDIKIGDFTVNNVHIGILDDGALLCGKGFLDKFKKWELDKENKILTLYK